MQTGFIMPETLNESDREFLSELSALGSASIAQLCEAQGVTTNAVRQRLNRLMASGFVERATVRQGRGRPQHDYQVTNAGRRLLSNNYSELALVLWRQIQHIPDEKIRRQIAEDLRKSLITRYGQEINGTTVLARIDQLQRVLQKYGYSVEVERENSQVALTENSCPYHDLAMEDSSICSLEQEVFEQILGVPLQLTQRCVDGHSCCRFEQVELDVPAT